MQPNVTATTSGRDSVGVGYPDTAASATSAAVVTSAAIVTSAAVVTSAAGATSVTSMAEETGIRESEDKVSDGGGRVSIWW